MGLFHATKGGRGRVGRPQCLGGMRSQLGQQKRKAYNSQSMNFQWKRFFEGTDGKIRYRSIALLGISVWLFFGVGGRSLEACDSPRFWTGGFGAWLLIAFLAGFASPQRPFSLGFTIVSLVLPAMLLKSLISSGGVGSMVVPGVILLGVLGLICSGAAQLGALIAKRRRC